MGGMKDMLNKWVIKELKDRNLSMRKLGKMAGLDQAHISRVLADKQEATLDFYLAIAKALDAIPEMLRAAGILSKHEEEQLTFSELVEAGRRLSPEQRKELLDYADYLLQKKPKSNGGESTAANDPAPATT